MPKIDNKKFYLSAIKKYAHSPRGVNWNNQESQSIRFNIINEMLPKELHTYTIADAGCGFGDFYTYLKTNQRTPKEYLGIDSLKEMLTITNKQTAQKTLLANICTDEIPVADYYICSGALNTLTKFETYQFINNCYKSSNIAFIFNVLYGTKESATYNYLTDADIKKIAQELNVSKIHSKKGYLANDITIGFCK